LGYNRKRRKKLVLAPILLFKILSYFYKIAKLAGEIARDIGRPIDFPDSAIAATAIINGGELFTLNKKDFKDIVNLKFYRLE